MLFVEYNEVFVRNNAYAMLNHINKEDIADGYQHTFLIRHPEKVASSLYHCICVKEVLGLLLQLGGNILTPWGWNIFEIDILGLNVHEINNCLEDKL